jgi:flagellar assembly factor FliW
MRKIISRFGEIEYDPEATLHFPQGMIGFDYLRDFIVMPNEKAGPLFWIQSVNDPMIAFVVTDPTNFFLDYLVAPDQVERDKLGIGEEDECFSLAVVTVGEDRSVTLNLAAPLLFSPKTNCALQVVLESGKYETKTPLPKI